MKSGTDQLLKFKLLGRDLGLPSYATEGLLCALWRCAETNTPDGAIGRLTNEEIALAIDWDKDPDELVAALVRRKWLDEHDGYRLVVHDWAEHCEHRVHRKLARRGEYFADGTMPDLSRCDAKERKRALEVYASHPRTTAGTPPDSRRPAAGCVPSPLPLPLPLPSSENLSGRPSSTPSSTSAIGGDEATDEDDHAKTKPGGKPEIDDKGSNPSRSERKGDATTRTTLHRAAKRETQSLRAFDLVRDEATQFAKAIKIDWSRERDRSLIVKLFYLREVGELSEAELADALGAVRTKNPHKPIAYLTTTLRNTLAARGQVLSVVLAKLEGALPSDWQACVEPRAKPPPSVA